eukprot:403349329
MTEQNNQTQYNSGSGFQEMTQFNVQDSSHSQGNSHLQNQQLSIQNISNLRHFCKFENCQKSFKRSTRLDQHFRTIHLKEDLHLCPFKHCRKSFAEKGNLKVHLRMHTGDRPFQCDVCRKTFSTTGNFKDHERRHSGIKPYQCKICDQDYYRKYQVRRHLQKKHPGLNVQENIIKMTSQQQSQKLRDVKVYQKKNYQELSKIQLDFDKESKKLNDEVKRKENLSQDSTSASFSLPQTPVISSAKANIDALIKNNNQNTVQQFIEKEESTKHGEILSYKQILEMSMSQSQNYENPKNISINWMQQFSGSLASHEEIFNNNVLKQENQEQNNQIFVQNQKNKEALFQSSKIDEPKNNDNFSKKQKIQGENLNKSDSFMDNNDSSQYQMISRINKPSSTLLDYFWKKNQTILQQQQDGLHYSQEENNTIQIPLNIKVQNNANRLNYLAGEEFRNNYLDAIFLDMDLSSEQSGNIDQIQYPQQTTSRKIEFNNSDTSPTRFLTECNNHKESMSQNFGIYGNQNSKKDPQFFSKKIIQQSIVTNQTRRPCQKKPSIIGGFQNITQQLELNKQQ